MATPAGENSTCSSIVPVWSPSKSTTIKRTSRAAWRRYGKGRHPAGLNFGDLFAYALAKATGDQLLSKGADFSRTDVEFG